MSRQQSLQSRTAETEHVSRALKPVSRPRNLKHWVSVKQLVVQLDFVTTAPGDPEEACRNWLRRHHIVSGRRGRTILVDPLDIDRALRGR